MRRASACKVWPSGAPGVKAAEGGGRHAALCYRRRMTPTSHALRRRSDSARSALAPLLALAALVGLGLGAAGCGQEGKTIQAVLPVSAVAYEATAAAVTASTLGDTLSATVNVKFKLLTTYANGCEARGGIEIKREGPDSSPLYVLTPLARYTADESCNIGAAGDTLQTITVNSMSLALPRTAVADSITRFEVRGFGTPPIRFDVNINVASYGDTTTGYYVWVEDKDTGARLDGANVRVERYGTPDVLGEGPTAGGGRFAFTVPCAGTAGSTADPYVVKVSYSGRIAVVRVVQHPALCKRRETIIVRV